MIIKHSLSKSKLSNHRLYLIRDNFGSDNCSFKSGLMFFTGGAFSFFLSFIVLTRFSFLFSFSYNKHSHNT